jgi:hypothetical protein
MQIDSTERYRIKQNTYRTVTKEDCKLSTKIKVSTSIQQCQISDHQQVGDAPNFHLQKDLEVVLVHISDHSHQIVSPAECWKVRSNRLEIPPFLVVGLFPLANSSSGAASASHLIGGLCVDNCRPGLLAEESI